MKKLSELVKSGVIATLGALMITSVSSASETLPAQQIGRIINYGNIVTIGVQPTNNNDSCTRNSGGTQNLIAFDSTTSAGKQFLAMALTAKATEAEVVIAVNNCTAFAGVTVPRVFRIELR